MNVLVTRAEGQGDELIARLREAGFTPIAVPLIRIEPVAFPSAAHETIRAAGRFSWIVFTSANAVTSFMSALHAVGRDGRTLDRAKLAAVGPATAAALAAYGCSVDALPDESTAAALPAALVAAGLKVGDSVLWPRGNLAAPELQLALEALGATVADPVVYETRPEPAAAGLIRAALTRGVDWVTFTSPSTVRSWTDALGSLVGLAAVRVAAIGPRTAAALVAAGRPPDAEADPHTAAGLVAALLQDRLSLENQSLGEASLRSW